ncbi:MAG: oligosaccharide flippase family protein [Bacillaceae bacterium]
MSDSKFLRGTLIVTLGTILIKILGMIYVIPFYQLVGEKGGALYTYGYNAYTIFLSIGTAGIPLAVSKFVSKYNALGQYEVSRKMFKNGIFLMIGTGIVTFLSLYLLAPVLANLYIAEGNEYGNTVEDVTHVMRLVSFALLIVPAMSLIRGFFQGHQSMGPTTTSQLLEQIVRIGVILIGSFVVIVVMDGSIATAVGVSTFAAFIGAVASLLLLLWYWMKRKHHFDELLEKSTYKSSASTGSLMFELIGYAIPFIFVGLALPLYQQIDTLTFNRAMTSIGLGDIAENAYGIYTMYSHKLITIPISLATAFSLTLVPAITHSFASRDYKGLQQKVTQTLQITLFLTIPAVVGISTLADPAYAAFYSYSELGGSILFFYAPVAILYSLFSVNAAILQGLNKQKYVIIGLFVGLALKAILNTPFIQLFETNGAILATAIGYGASILLMSNRIKKHGKISFKRVYRRVLLMTLLTVAMVIAVLFTRTILELFLDYSADRMQAIIIVGVGAIVGVIVYVGIAWKINLIQKMFGSDLLDKVTGRFRRFKRG